MIGQYAQATTLCGRKCLSLDKVDPSICGTSGWAISRRDSTGLIAIG
jgi:hypothetical protein